MFERPDKVPYPLYVVTTVFNSPRFRTRWKLYEDFAKRVKESGAVLYVAEVALGHRKFAIEPPDGDKSRLLQLRTWDELWIKENTLNLLMQRLPLDAQAVAWIDADVQFVRDDWANEILHGLQHYKILQPWSKAIDLTDNYEPFQEHHSFMYSWANDEPFPPDDEPGYYYAVPKKMRSRKLFTWHPGFAWAAWRKHLSELSMLIDWAILGSADMHMAKALIGRAETSMHPKIQGEYRDAVMRWQSRADKYIAQDVGYIEGTILHHWHGPKVRRRYKDRWSILVDNNFNPLNDIKRDWQGLWQFSENKPKLRDDIRKYFKQRNEDEPHIED